VFPNDEYQTSNRNNYKRSMSQLSNIIQKSIIRCKNYYVGFVLVSLSHSVTICMYGPCCI
jgi:hypothetical protein